MKVVLPINSIDHVKCLNTLKERVLLCVLTSNTHSLTMPSTSFLNLTAYGGFDGKSKWIWISCHLFNKRKITF